MTKSLRNCHRVKEINATWQLNAICDPEMDPVLEKENAIKDILGTSDQTGI